MIKYLIINKKRIDYMSYRDLPLDEYGDYDLKTFNTAQLKEFYWDHPESLPDNI